MIIIESIDKLRFTYLPFLFWPSLFDEILIKQMGEGTMTLNIKIQYVMKMFCSIIYNRKIKKHVQTKVMTKASHFQAENFFICDFDFSHCGIPF